MPHKPTSRRPLSPQKSLQTKNATRHESLLNALLALCRLVHITQPVQMTICPLFATYWFDK